MSVKVPPCEKTLRHTSGLLTLLFLVASDASDTLGEDERVHLVDTYTPETSL